MQQQQSARRNLNKLVLPSKLEKRVVTNLDALQENTIH